MKTTSTSLPGVVIIEPTVFRDSRGYFLEAYREKDYLSLLAPGLTFVQDNHSFSTRGVLRGLHMQTRKPQGKLVRVVRGEIFDVAVDVNPDSPEFGEWFGIILSDKNQMQLYIPPGYAHGFQVLSECADVEYKCTDYYDPGGESGLLWNDTEVGIQWPNAKPLLNEKDLELPHLADIARAHTG